MSHLGLRFDAHEEHPLPRRSSRPAWIAITLVAVAFALVIGVAVVGVSGIRGLFGSADWTGDGYGSVIVQVHPGDTATDIGTTLVAANVVRSVGAFRTAAENDPRSLSIVPGYYRLREHMAAARALALLLSPKSLVRTRVTIPEGFTVAATFTRIAGDTSIPIAALRAAAADPAALGVPSWAGGRLEGFLFPATYDVVPGEPAVAVLRAMVAAFTGQEAALNLVAAAPRVGLTPYQALTLASIVQREGRLASDFPKIARVFINRLAQGMPLGSDATLFYVLGPNHGPLTATDLALDSPYNTRLHTGFPPTPIDNPGAAALAAVLDPTPGPWLYFVTIDKAGHAAFATTLAQHNANVAISRANGVE